MIQKVKGEAPFQVLASNFSIGPSNEGYTLQISADGSNYSDLFSVGANVTRMVTGVANGSYYRLSGNNSDVTVNWRTQCNDGGGGGGSSDYAASAGTANTAIISNSTRLLDGVPNFPQDANNGDVVAIGEATPTRGLRSGAKASSPTTGVYQYDGSDWNKIEGGEGFEPWRIDLSTNIPEDLTEGDIDVLNNFFSDALSNPAIIDTAYVVFEGSIYHIIYSYINTNSSNGEFWFAKTNVELTEEIGFSFANGEYSEGYYHFNPTSYLLELSTPNPDDFDANDIANINELLNVIDGGGVDIYNVVIRAAGYVYQLAYYDGESTLGFSWEAAFAPRLQYIELHYEDGEYTYGAYTEWEPSEASDVVLLKSVSSAPEGVDNGDVFALITPAQEGSWTTFDASAEPKLVRILTKADGTYLIHFNNDNLFIGLDYTAGDPPTFSGSGWGLQQDDTYDWHYDNNGYYIKVWAEDEKGEWYIYAEMTQGDGGFSMLDAYNLGSVSEMYYGEEPEKVGVFQRVVESAEDIVEVTYPECSDEGNGRWQGYKVRVSVSGVPDDDYYLTEYEYFDNLAELHIDGDNLYLHNNSLDSDIFSIPITGGIGSGFLGEVFIMATFVEGVFNIQTYTELAFNDQGAVVNGFLPSDVELARKSDIPTPTPIPDPVGYGGRALISDDAEYVFTDNPVVQSYDTASSLGVVRNIVRIYQSDYDDLVNNDSVDESTLYIIIEDPQV